MKLPAPFPRSSRSRHGLRPLLMGLALSLASLPLHAQETPPPVEVQATPRSTTQVQAQAAATIIPRAQFQGSSLGEVVEYLAEQSGANLMIAPEVKGLAVPDMNLRNVTGIGVLRAIADMGVPFQITETPPETPGETSVWVITPTMMVPEVETNVTRIYTLRDVQPPSATTPGPVSPEVFEILVRDISDAINVALQARQEATKGKVHNPVLKIHQATRVMVVSGNQQEVDISTQVICALGGMPVN